MARRELDRSNPASFIRIWSVVARIPRGRVATYGQVARMAGLIRGARTAGWALQALPNRFVIEGRAVPWHRVINSAGCISPRGGDGGDLAVLRQAERLRREGIRITGRGRIDLDLYQWSGEPAPASHGKGRAARATPST